MATKCFCDRCGAAVEDLFHTKVLKVKRHCESGGQIWDSYQNYDPCARCFKKVDDFLTKEGQEE